MSSGRVIPPALSSRCHWNDPSSPLRKKTMRARASSRGRVSSITAMRRPGEILERRKIISPRLTITFRIWSSTLLLSTAFTPS
jgi:hypothetical protein